MEIRRDIDLKPLHTFGLPARAAYFAQLRDEAQLPALCALPEFARGRVLWLGGGSNLLFRGDYDGLVVKTAMRGIHEIGRGGGFVRIEAAAGEVWHDFVCETLRRGLCGLENLSLIPGTVGAAPVQNIGAYGVEIQDVLDGVRCFDLAGRNFVYLSREDCGFGYRDSLFKRQGGRYVICSAVFKLARRFTPKTAYGDLAAVLADMCGGRAPTAQDVAQAVCSIRRSKLPDPAVCGNAGSFFKNPLADTAHARALAAQYPHMPRYPQADGRVKLAAGWLIEQCGLKGFRMGGAAVHEKQALVLVNTGHAIAQDVEALAEYIRSRVEKKFGLSLEAEPNWV
ncbi:MAG: UDP-N-acetylmuramate dehydrogenase [Neisseria sp.]|nr:UDP-N-acetylmuramate dehydrogenase [Neisseria sp.]